MGKCNGSPTGSPGRGDQRSANVYESASVLDTFYSTFTNDHDIVYTQMKDYNVHDLMVCSKMMGELA